MKENFEAIMTTTSTTLSAARDEAIEKIKIIVGELISEVSEELKSILKLDETQYSMSIDDDFYRIQYTIKDKASVKAKYHKTNEIFKLKKKYGIGCITTDDDLDITRYNDSVRVQNGDGSEVEIYAYENSYNIYIYSHV